MARRIHNGVATPGAVKISRRFGELPALALMFFFLLKGNSYGQLRGPSQTIPPSFFGLHIHNAGTKTPWPNVAVPEWRLWDAHVSWADLEPARGMWHFDTLDRYVSMAQEHNTEILLTFGYTPAWASARPDEPSASKPGFAAEPKNLEDWRTFVEAVASRYKGCIHSYEIWNEPNLKQFWSGSTDQLVAMTRMASEVIHGVDPQAVVVSPSATTTAGTPWLSDFLHKGGGAYADVIGYHFYVYPEPPESMITLIQKVKQIMADNDVSFKPLWNTETGWSKPKPFPSDDLAAAYLARAYILSWSAGAQRFYWYAWDNHGWVSLETTEDDNETLKPAGLAYGVMQKWLIGARVSECNQDKNHTWVCQLSRGGTPERIVWNTDQQIEFAVPPSWQANSFSPLLGEQQSLVKSSIDVGQVPVLIGISQQ